jgi:hypothetical protein
MAHAAMAQADTASRTVSVSSSRSPAPLSKRARHSQNWRVSRVTGAGVRASTPHFADSVTTPNLEKRWRLVAA